MLRRLIVLSLVACFAQFAGLAFGQRSEQAKAADQTRAALVKIGTCPKNKAEVLLHDKTVLKGCVVDISDDHFGIVDAKTGKATRVNYDDVVRLKRLGRAAWKDWAFLGTVIAIPAILLSVGLRGG